MLCEECDMMQGVQCFSDFDTGFGGLTKEFITDIKDNYAKTPILIYGVSPHKKFTHQVTFPPPLLPHNILEILLTFLY